MYDAENRGRKQDTEDRGRKQDTEDGGRKQDTEDGGRKQDTEDRGRSVFVGGVRTRYANKTFLQHLLVRSFLLCGTPVIISVPFIYIFIFYFL